MKRPPSCYLNCTQGASTPDNWIEFVFKQQLETHRKDTSSFLVDFIGKAVAWLNDSSTFYKVCLIDNRL